MRQRLSYSKSDPFFYEFRVLMVSTRVPKKLVFRVTKLAKLGLIMLWNKRLSVLLCRVPGPGWNGHLYVTLVSDENETIEATKHMFFH